MTQIWGIVNVTPDSFSDGGRYADTDDAIAQARVLLDQGAAVIDVGGESTRPGAKRIPAVEEQARVLPVVGALAQVGIRVSVDTFNSATARLAIDAGARYINDVSGGLSDPDMFSVVADSSADIVIGHWRGPSADMYVGAEYHRVSREVAGELQDRITAAAGAGIPPNRIILDPGIGFAKRGDQNWDMLRGLGDVIALGARVLVGTSRKRFLGDALGADADEARLDAATAVTSALAFGAGAWAVRVHNAAATRDAIRVAQAWGGRL